MKTIARLGTVAFIAIAITMAAIELRDTHASPAVSVPISATSRATDPLGATLRRCQALGGASATDPACLRAWADTRRRFLTGSARSDADLPDQRATNGTIARRRPTDDLPAADRSDAANGAED